MLYANILVESIIEYIYISLPLAINLICLFDAILYVYFFFHFSLKLPTVAKRYRPWFIYVWICIRDWQKWNYFLKSQFNNFVIAKIINFDLRHTLCDKMLFLDSGIPCIERHRWTSSVYFTPISACSLRRYYKTSYKCIKWLIELK